jgi:Flp pilus assembly pilin Flp
MTRRRIITYGIIAAIISVISITGYKSMIPTNGNIPLVQGMLGLAYPLAAPKD